MPEENVRNLIEEKEKSAHLAASSKGSGHVEKEELKVKSQAQTFQGKGHNV